MTADEVQAFLDTEFPQAAGLRATIEQLAPGRALLRRPVSDADLRPGGTLSGPTLMALADLGVYVLVLAMVGPEALAVTTHLSIDFLRRPAPADVLAEVELLKLGRRLAVARVTLRSGGDPEPIAHATLTYAIPPPGAA